MKRLLLLLSIPAVLLLWWAAKRQESAVNVRVITVQRRTVDSTILTNGRVEPAQWAAARAQVAGVVERTWVARGAEVAANAPLAALDATAAETELEAALATREQARAEANAVAAGGPARELADLGSSERSAEQALHEAERNLESTQRLVDRNAATKADLLSAQDAVARARNLLRQSEERRKALVGASDQAVSAAKLRDANSAVDLARRRVALATVRAPLAGTVYQFDLKQGSYLNVGDLVALVGKLDQVRIKIYVDEPELGRVRNGVPVVVTWQGRPGQQWTGHVEQLPTEITMLNTRNVGEVWTLVDNPRHELLPGVNVDVEIFSQTARDAVAIPKQALRERSGQDGVYRLTGNRLTWQPVTAGVSDANFVEIKRGLNASERIAVPPSEGDLPTGTVVKPIPE